MLVAALYVAPRGVYGTLPGVDPWGLPERDARAYAGPSSVVGHPPCGRWGRFATGGPSHAGRFERGADEGCFAACLDAVRVFGGVLEHPAGSSAWRAFGLVAPPAGGGWVSAGDLRGYTCAVSQGHYGHPAPKPSWLYAVRTELPALIWGPSSAPGRVTHLCHRKREATPRPFAELLVALARSVEAAGDLGLWSLDGDTTRAVISQVHAAEAAAAKGAA